MKKLIILISVIFAVVLVCGCVQQDVSAGEDLNEPEDLNTAENDHSDSSMDDGSSDDVDVSEIEQPDSSIDGESANEVPFSQEELDKLKEDLEMLEFEDLDDFSGE